jgi:electron transfer flavoprotein alpha subunit
MEPTSPTDGARTYHRPLHTVALVKQVPLGDHPGTLDSAGRLVRQGAGVELNPWCRRAVTRAVELGRGSGGRTTVVTMGPPAAADVLKEALACGADDGLHVSDPALAGADCLVTAKALAAAIRTLGPVDLVVVGRSTVDGGTGTVGPMVAALLGLPFAGPALTVEAASGTAGGGLLATLQLDAATETVGLALPAVLAIAERSCPPAKATPDRWPEPAAIRTLTADRLPGSAPGAASPTRVHGVLRVGTARRPLLLTGSPAQQAARAVDLLTARDTPADRQPAVPQVHPAAHPQNLAGPAVLAVTGSPQDGGRALLGEAAELAGMLAGHVVAITPPADTGLLGAWGADATVRLGGDAPRLAAAALADWIRRCRSTPWAVLGGATPWDREVLARLAVHLDTGLLSDLTGTAIRFDGGRPRLVGRKPAGGGTLAEVGSDRQPQVATVRTGSLPGRAARPVPRHALPAELLAVAADPLLRRFDRHTVDDFDAVERAGTVIGLGAGVDPARHADIEPLRALLGAEFAATRKVTDAGSLPHCRQLGVTGRGIAPRLYLALGISGSPHHMAGVERAHTVLAVNSDPQAAVFGHCDIGIVADWQDVVPALTAAFTRAARTGEAPVPA